MAIGKKTLVPGEAERNLLKGKTNNPGWKRYLSFGFGNAHTTKDKAEEKQEKPNKPTKGKFNSKEILKLNEEGLQKHYSMAACCHPIPGDDVLAYVEESSKVTIHKRQCSIAAKLKSSYGHRILATEWDTHKQLLFPVSIQLKGIDSVGLLSEITQVISVQLQINMRQLALETNEGIVEGKLQVWVHDAQEVKLLCEHLKKIPNIKQANRIEC